MCDIGYGIIHVRCLVLPKLIMVLVHIKVLALIY
jgi:hypothetical protein